MRILGGWGPWVPLQLLGSFQEPSACMPVTEPAESFAETPETGAMPSREGSWLRSMKTNQPTLRGTTEKGQGDKERTPKVMPFSHQCQSSSWLWSQTFWVQVLLLLPTNCVTLGKLLKFSVSSPIKHNNSITLIRFLWGLHVNARPRVTAK